MELFFEDPVPYMASGASETMARDAESTIIKYVRSQHSVSFGLENYFYLMFHCGCLSYKKINLKSPMYIGLFFVFVWFLTHSFLLITK